MFFLGIYYPRYIIDLVLGICVCVTLRKPSGAFNIEYRMTSEVFNLYDRLLTEHGDPVELWPQWCAKEKDTATREIIIIGSILVQRTSWRNAEKALVNLRNSNLLSLKSITNTSIDTLTPLILVAGFYTSKPYRLKTVASHIVNKYGSVEKMLHKDTDELREELLSLMGVGSETADTILLYGLNKPTFIIDAYTKRFITKYNLTRETEYQKLKMYFEESLPKKVKVYQDMHVLMIADDKGKDWCKMQVVE